MCGWDTDPKRWAIEMDVYLHPPKGRKCINICYEKTSPAFVQSFQFFVCDFFLLPEGLDREEKAQCMEIINKLHTEFAGVSL